MAGGLLSLPQWWLPVYRYISLNSLRPSALCMHALIKLCVVLPVKQAYLSTYPGKSCGFGLCAWSVESAQVGTSVQVLKDAELKAAYDEQLDRAGHSNGVFISNEVCS